MVRCGVCYVEGKNGGLGVKRRNVNKDEQTGKATRNRVRYLTLERRSAYKDSC